MFGAADFELFDLRFQSDPEWNGRRLEIRRRLQALGDRVKGEYAAAGVSLDRRESLHHPHASNRKRVARQRTMLFRDRKARKSLQGFLGKELGKDLDSAHNNVHLQAGLDRAGCFWGLRVEAGAWYDLNVLLKRAEEGAGQRALVEACRAAKGFELRVDGRGARPADGVSARDWRDIAGIVRPGESELELRCELPAAQAVAAGASLEDRIAGELGALAAFLALTSWTLDGSSPSGASL
ncbi:MAG TPA: hypothetical protein VGC54_08035 [Planctomycetota bacterium]